MPIPLFERPTPRPDESPAPRFAFRFSAISGNVRSIFNGSSVYSNSPPPTAFNTPKPPFLGFFRGRQQEAPPLPTHNANHAPFDPSLMPAPLQVQPQHTAGSYIGVLSPHPNAPASSYLRHVDYVPLNGEPRTFVDPETEQLAEEANQNRRRRRRKRNHSHHQGHAAQHHHRRRRHRRYHSSSHSSHSSQGYWVRRKDERGICFSFMKGKAARGKGFAVLISGLLLLSVLTIYLALALTRKSLHQELHVLFIMLILGITIFFCHSLIRLCMLALRPDPVTPPIPSITGPDGFKPVHPIRVHLARDAEIARENAADLGDVDPGDLEKGEGVKVPPPAYGLWRESVRVDPNLLHWRKVDDLPPHVRNSVLASPQRSEFNPFASPAGAGNVVMPMPNPLAANLPLERTTTGNAPSATPSGNVPGTGSTPDGQRPPSYMSDDGVEYVVSAAPRSTAPRESTAGMSDVHPAWRPGFAMSEVGEVWTGMGAGVRR